MRASGILLLAALAAGPLLAGGEEGRRLEIFSVRGVKRRVKIYSGESVTFFAREHRPGLSGIFTPGEPLKGVRFVLRSWPRVRQDSLAIAKGANRGVIRERRPGPDLWGTPPDSFTIVGGSRVGRTVLEATRPGYQAASVVVHLATFEIVDIEAVLTKRDYTADFDLRLVDPDEAGRAIPLLVESLDEEGRLVDARKDVVLAPVMLRADEYRTSRRIRLSSTEVESFRARLARQKEAPLPVGFLDRKAMRVAAGGMLRISFRTLILVYGLPLGS